MIDASEAVTARLRALTEEHRLTSGSLRAIEALLRTFETDLRAPTASRAADAAVDVHLADSLVGLGVREVRTAGLIVDVGSGAGLPGLPLAAVLPRTTFVLLESNRRKATWIDGLASVMGLENVEPLALRAEEWSRGPVADVVTARALAALPVLVEYAAPLLRIGGALVAWKGAPEAAEEEDGAAAAESLGLELEQVRPVQPFPASRDRRLYVYRKAAETPAGYPRRPGMAVKRPLRADRRPR